ncbi:MAG: DUF427 domain-containing protein [Myxococcota bacterium]
MKAQLNGTTVAESETTERVEGNHYFPPESLVNTHFEPSDRTTHCGWKGTANYFHLVVEGKRFENAAWVYKEPLPKAENIRDHVAFYPVVSVSE